MASLNETKFVAHAASRLTPGWRGRTAAYCAKYVVICCCVCWLGTALVAALGAPASDASLAPVFRDVTTAAGIRFVHDNAATPDKYMIETMGSGCGWIDYDGDGLLDIYLVNSAITEKYKPSKRLRSALYHNNGNGAFTDVTERAGVGAEGLFGMGVAVGDFDNDGWPDLFVGGYGRSILYRNRGDGTFEDVTLQTGVGNEGSWASSAAWFDFNNDGRLDLAIANYVDWSPAKNAWCGDRARNVRAYCHPNTYPGQKPRLYRNDGGGKFTDVTTSSGLASRPSSGLGIVTFDYDGDGLQDIFIANDASMNSLFRNLGNGRFQEIAFAAGVAVSEDGKAEAGMGVDVADTTGTGRLDLIVTHLDFEHARLYRNLGEGLFTDATFEAKLGYATYQYSGFGVLFTDYDNDAQPDLFIANGHILENIDQFHAKTQYAEPKLMLRNADGRFENVTTTLGSALSDPRVSRGAAAGDYDNDGRVDLLVSNNGETPQLLHNEPRNGNHHITLKLIGTASNRDAVGAKVRIKAGALRLFAERKGGGSYQSAHDPRLHFGLGTATVVDEIEVSWPSGRIDRISTQAVNSFLVIREGAGVIPPEGAR